MQERKDAETRNQLVDSVVQAVWGRGHVNCLALVDCVQDPAPEGQPRTEQELRNDLLKHTGEARDIWVMCVDRVCAHSWQLRWSFKSL